MTECQRTKTTMSALIIRRPEHFPSTRNPRGMLGTTVIRKKILLYVMARSKRSDRTLSFFSQVWL